MHNQTPSAARSLRSYGNYASDAVVERRATSKWSLKGRKLILATAAVGLGGIGAIGVAAPASADASGPCLDEGNGDGWGVNPDTNEGCVISGFNAAEICLDDDGDGRGFNPALNDSCELDNDSELTSIESEPQPEVPEERDPYGPTDSSRFYSADGWIVEHELEIDDGYSSGGYQQVTNTETPEDCVDEGDGNGWGVNPATNEGCWIDGVDTSICDDLGSEFECPDGATYPTSTDSPTGNYPGAYDEVDTAEPTEAPIEQVDQTPVSEDAMCSEHGASASYYSSDGSFAGCTVCIDQVAPFQDGFGPGDNESLEGYGFTECYKVDPQTGERLPYSSGKSIPQAPTPSESESSAPASQDSTSSTSSSSPHVVHTPDNVEVHYDRDKVTIIGGNEHTDAPYIYLADSQGQGHGTKLIGDPVPICEQGIVSDDDGDGYGTENGEICYAGVAVGSSPKNISLGSRYPERPLPEFNLEDINLDIDLEDIGSVYEQLPDKNNYASVVEQACQDSFGGEIRSEDGACVVACFDPLVKYIHGGFGDHSSSGGGELCEDVIFF